MAFNWRKCALKLKPPPLLWYSDNLKLESNVSNFRPFQYQCFDLIVSVAPYCCKSECQTVGLSIKSKYLVQGLQRNDSSLIRILLLKYYYIIHSHDISIWLIDIQFDTVLCLYITYYEIQPLQNSHSFMQFLAVKLWIVFRVISKADFNKIFSVYI